MSAANKLVFANPDGVGGSPTIDGFAMADIGVLSSDVDGGYINGGRVTLGNSSGIPPVVVQAIRDGSTIVLGIMCRGDTSSFDDVDGVVIGLRPSGGTSGGPQRKIHIFPMWGDAPDPASLDPTDPTTLGVGFGAADPDPANAGAHLVVPPEDPQYTIRKNKQPHFAAQYFGRAGASGAWAAANPGNKNDPAKFHVRTRSWLPPVAAGSPAEYAWSVEVRLPVSNAVAGGDWLDLADDFGLFIDVIRCFRVFDDDGQLDYQASHYVFPIGAPFLDPVSASTDIPAASFGRGLMGSAAANGEGVRIKNGALGIGRRAGAPGTPPVGDIRVDQPNIMVAQLENTGPFADKISAQVYVAQFGLNGPGDWSPHWVQPTGLQNPGPQISVPAFSGVPGQNETTNDWTVSASDIAFYTNHRHQCIWVQLDSGDPNVTFSRASVRRNMDFAGFSAITRDVVISGDGYREPENGSGEHEFVLRTRCRKLVVRELQKAPQGAIDDATVTLVKGALMHDARENMPGPFDRRAAVAGNDQQWQDTVVYLWVTEGFRRTGRRTEINGIKAELLDESPGDFSICARHEGVDDPMNWAFSGGGMVQHAPGVYSVKVAHKGKVEVKVRLAAGREERAGDRSDLPNPRKPGDSDGGRPPSGCLASLFGIFGKRS